MVHGLPLLALAVLAGANPGQQQRVLGARFSNLTVNDDAKLVVRSD